MPSQSGDEGSLDLDAERPLIIPDGFQDDGLLDFSDSERPKSRHRRQSSSSSQGFVVPPPDTDYSEPDMYGPSSGVEDIDQEEEVEPEPVPKRKKTVQQKKYEQERPQISASRVVHAQPAPRAKISPESDWHKSARIIFPATGSAVKLLEQNPLLKSVLTDAIALELYELGFINGYPPVPSREAYTSKLLRRVAKKNPDAIHIEKRAKRDPKFCQRLASIILARSGNTRNGLRNAAISKVATHYELNKAGITPSEVRGIVKQLMANQCFIFAYAVTPPIDNADADAAVPDGDTVAASKGNPRKTTKVFNTGKPFFAPLIIDLAHETWWSSRKALGFKHVADLKSNRADRPTEVVLPDAMMCMAGAHAWAALQAYQTGVYVPAPEFSQGRLENTYQSLLSVMEQQRSNSPKTFNRIMHELYLKVSNSTDSTALGTGSANIVISLAIDSD
ncbi:hypothetical protein DFH08DRAFT_802122 [Mycena albidolilacea]|uniref:DUF6532 domain-containing protein n=1 Tax=Mycena albidolilacea TaxID=1033008 RepID=A0AAD7AGS3_9AGAR|nr:hypothetical protein DFH08DRAFT_802122 [Mycena albidolilacea]